ncbi:MAG: UvrD-helicase domain-containing protein [Clostridiales Family XIII bacterium]|jgi:ATP-dependent helicase/nuclease subunit A|nr:UvrD-helicase domain-containing protein [Clostridiales Family XIII bacterium]
MKWNKEQEEAIKSKKKNILVSAAAGSGKTAVLVERIGRLILEEKVPISEMLIVTFTNAAAAEMRRRIMGFLTDRLAEEGSAERRPAADERAFLRKQLSELYGAQISTFHAFALSVIREYHFKIGLAPELRICDEARRSILRNETADELFARRFADDYDNFTDFLRRYAGEKDEESLRNDVLFAVYDAIRAEPHPFERLRERVAFLYKPPRELLADGVAKAVLEDVANELKKARAFCLAVRDLVETCGARAYLPLCDADADGLAALIETAEGADPRDASAAQDVLGAVSCFEFARFAVSDKEEKAKYEPVKEDVTRLRGKAKRILREGVTERYCMRSLIDYAVEINETAPHAAYLAELLEDFDEIFKNKKLEHSLMDFADAEHYALEILDDEEVSAAYRRRFRHIFVDEYQDSNLMQETLIARINEGNGLFMVGDVKQSIYKFRLAEPELFMRKYEEYGRGGDPERLRLDLSVNYRSKAPVVDAINGVFRGIMKPDTAGLDYDENAALRKGLAFENEEAWNRKALLCVIDDDSDGDAEESDSGVGAEGVSEGSSGKSDADAGVGAEGRPLGEDDARDAIRELQRAEIEAHAAVELVKNELRGEDGERRRFFDAKKGEARALSLRDIVVLMRGARNQADVFRRVFEESGLPAYTDTGVGYFDTVEIETFMNLLRVIDNRRRDIALLSVMYSPIFGFSTRELMDIRLAAPRAAYCDALLFCAEAPASASGGETAEDASRAREGPAAPLRAKIRDMLARLDAWRESAAFMPLDEFVWTLLRESGYHTFAGALQGGAQRRANLRALADKALDFQNAHMKGLAGFISYVEHVRKKVDVGQTRLVGENEDVLRIMTVHKSKGLEFPVVIVAGMGRRFVSERMGVVSVHKEVGFALRRADPATGLYSNTLLQKLIARRRAAENLAEEIRILYVAFTRAMDRLILLGTAKGGIEGLRKRGALADGRSHLALVAREAEAAGFVVQTIKAKAGAAPDDIAARPRDLAAFFASTDECDPETAREVKRRLGFSYPFAKAAAMKSKYTVTELAAARAEALGAAPREMRPFSATAPRFLSGARAPDAAERGSLLHRALERLDFRAVREGLARPGRLEEDLRALTARGVFTPEEAAVVDVARLRNFFESDICRRAAAAPELYKETPFVIRKESDGEEILVQGVIDCWFVENGSPILIDYKSGSAFASFPEAREAAISRFALRYGAQLAVYAEAIEAIRGARVSEAWLFLLGEGLCVPVELA